MSRTYDVEATYNGDDLEANFTATATETNFPDEMPGRDLDKIELDALTILGVEINPLTEFPKLPAALQYAIWDLAYEIEWRVTQ